MSDTNPNLKNKLQSLADDFNSTRKLKFLDRILILLNQAAEEGRYKCKIDFFNLNNQLCLRATDEEMSQIREELIAQGLTISEIEPIRFLVSWKKMK